MVSSSLSRLVPFTADTSTSSTSPPMDLDEDLVLQQFGADALRIGVRLVDLVDGDDDRHPAALAWLIASIVCGMTPSSAATTSTTISVTLAPRARMAVNAAWPGVSMKVIFWPLRST